MVTLLMIVPAGGMAQAQGEIEYISFSSGSQKSILTYGLHAALSETWQIHLTDSGSFSVNVPFASTTAPTQSKPPFTVEVMNMRMQGTWNDKDAQGTFTLTATINTTRTTYSYLDDPMGNDEWYYVTTYNYSDAVTASGTISREASQLVFSMDAVVNRTGYTRLVSVIVNDGQTTTGDNPTITDKSGTFSETAIYRFTISEVGGSVPAGEPTPTASPEPPMICPEIHCNRDTNPRATVRFGDLWGEVNVRQNWEDESADLFAWIEMGLCHCDRIRTRSRSGAVLSWSDLSTFIMKEDTIIVLDIANEREGLIGVIAGNIMVNMNKMIKDGSMEVVQFNVIAGMKGTTAIFEENGTTSTIKVIEGTVEVRPNAGAPLTLSDGEMVSATNGVASAVVPFSVEDEMQTWDENGQQMIAQALAERKSSVPSTSSPTWILISAITGLLCFGLIIVILLVGLAAFNAKKKKTRIDKAFQSDAIKSQLDPVLPTSQAMSPKPLAVKPDVGNLSLWQCTCGSKNVGLFCPKCGMEKPTSTDVQNDAST